MSLAVIDIDSDPSAERCTMAPDDGSTFPIRLAGSTADQRSRLMELVAAPLVRAAASAAGPNRH